LCSPHIRYIALPLFLVDILTTVIYTLSLHDALPISKLTLEEKAIARSFFLLTSKPTIFACNVAESDLAAVAGIDDAGRGQVPKSDRKSTRLNSSHQIISYAVFCLKKNKSRNKVSELK